MTISKKILKKKEEIKKERKKEFLLKKKKKTLYTKTDTNQIWLLINVALIIMTLNPSLQA